MRWLGVARHRFLDALASRAFWVRVAVFAVALPGVAVGYAVVAVRPTAATLTAYQIELAAWLVPIAALAAGYDAVARQREDGTLETLLGMPHRRRDVVLAALVERFVAVAVAVVAGFLALGLAAALVPPGMSPLRLGVSLALALALAAAFTGVAVAGSVLARSAAGAMGVAVAAFVVFLFAWDLVPAAAHLLRFGELPGNAVPPDWFYLLQRVNPVEAFRAAHVETWSFLAPPGGAQRSALLGLPAALAVLAAWIALPVVVAVHRFDRSDLS